ncbi:MAG: TetR family transcriptional regulator [Erysipelotrichia bacterium]|nr:TetR family transcriptional regulator [Erysipelotrichia bacterium]NCC54303.1 TetR family transcriptional regulator [Erysipelotrichia bacterium]
MSQITKDALKQSFMQLLEEKTLDSIKVKDIVSRCSVNRNTFYYHFHDIYELMDYIFTSEAEQLITLNKVEENWQESFTNICNYLLTHKKMIYHVYFSINREQLEKYLYDVVSDVLLKIIHYEVKDKKISEQTCKILCDFFKYALVGMFLEWIREGMKEKVEDILYKIELVFDGSIEHILLNCEGK